MNLISNKFNRLYLVIALVLVIPDTFYWYTLNDYSNYQDTFTAISGSTGLTWLLISYLALFFAIFAKNLEMRAFLTATAFITRIFFLVWITDIWRSNEVTFPTLLKNVFIKTGEAPYIEAFATIALIPIVLSLIIQKSRIAYLLTALVNYLKAPANTNQRIIYFALIAGSYVVFAFVMIRSLFDNYELTRADSLGGFQMNYLWLIILGIFAIALKLLILGLALLAALWAWINWQSDIKTVLGHMKDFSLSEYLTRRVASYLYTLYFLGILALAAVGIPIYASTTFGVNKDYAAFPLVTLAGVVVTFLVLLVTRLIFELAVAIIHIAENTKSSGRK